MPHALLLSPDDQAVSAITGVLEEMSVTCERPLDGTSAAQKLNTQSFDLVLVDCENLPAAKLIFDVCRRGKNGNNPVPIAIVDGRAGLPTAFRLGAELILTKPVAKDQARTTIRTAVSRVRKDVPANENVPVHSASAAAGAVDSEAHAYGAAAGGSSAQLTNFAEPAPSFAPSSTPSASSAATSAAATAMKMSSTVEETTAPVAPKLNPKSVSSLSLSEPSSAAAVSVKSKLVPPTIPSDDPVLAELERTEQEASDLSEVKEAQIRNSEPKAKPAQPEPQAFAPVFSYQQNRQKPRGTLVALFVLMLACAGFYAAWTYQPGFREIAQPQIDRVLVLIDRGLVLAGIEHPQQSPPPASNAPKPSAQPAPATTPATASESPTDPNQTPSTTPDSAASSPTASATSSTAAPAVANAANASTQPAGTLGKTTAALTSPATTAAAPVVPKPTDSKINDSKLNDSKKDAIAAALSSAPLPGENNAIILSSKGAEKRLFHSVPPKYPAEARSGAEGTIVLKEVVDEMGKVDGVRLVEGDATLAAAAIKAVKQWRYRPYVRDGKVQAFQTVVIIDFQHP
ncbi:MAG: TonB family protein [Terriglobales bacterium]